MFFPLLISLEVRISDQKDRVVDELYMIYIQAFELASYELGEKKCHGNTEQVNIKVQILTFVCLISRWRPSFAFSFLLLAVAML